MSVAWLDVNAVSLRYALAGAGEPIVLLHEMGGALESWDYVVPLLVGEHQVLRFDMRGAGLSEKIIGSVTLDDLVADLAALLDALGLDRRVTLAGCAVGAAIAIRFASQYPQRVRGVVAMSPALGVPADRHAFAMARAASVEQEGMRPMTVAGHDRAYPAQLRRDTTRTNMLRGIKLANDPSSFAAIQRMLAAVDMTNDLAGLRCPALFLGGELDGTRPPEMVRAMAAMVENAQFEAVTSGHAMGFLTPELVADRLTRFMASL